jgi:hypothetical protein
MARDKRLSYFCSAVLPGQMRVAAICEDRLGLVGSILLVDVAGEVSLYFQVRLIANRKT